LPHTILRWSVLLGQSSWLFAINLPGATDVPTTIIIQEIDYELGFVNIPKATDRGLTLDLKTPISKSIIERVEKHDHDSFSL